MSEPESALSELRKMVIAQKMALLPSEAPGPAFGPLHAAIQDYDSLVSQAVIAAIQQREVEVPPETIQAARSAAQHAIEMPGLPPGREIAGYQKYKQRLDNMADLLSRLG